MKEAIRAKIPQARPVVLGDRPGDSNRNLGIGLTTMVLSAPLAAFAFWWAPREGFVAVLTAVFLAVLIFLALQFRILLQRNGTFLLLGVGLLVTLTVPIFVRLASTGSEWAGTLVELRGSRNESLVASGPASVAPTLAPVPAQVNVPATALRPASAPVPAASVAPNRATTSAPPAPPAAAASGERPAASAGPDALAQSKVPSTDSGATSSASTTASPFNPAQDAAATEAAQRAEQVILEKVMARLAMEDPQSASRISQREMLRRYPALEDSSSKEANLYREAYNELARLRKFDFFKDPQWPLNLAEMIAAREGWVRSDLAPLSGAANRPSEASAKGDTAVKKSPALPGEDLALESAQALSKEDQETREINQSMIEARRRYPAIGVEGSPENKAYLEAFQELDKLRPDFFLKRDWPIRLVELVAKQENWKRTAAEDSAPKQGVATKELPLPR